jgi:pimeloyl-ACP methyl ester carboxylesterase
MTDPVPVLIPNGGLWLCGLVYRTQGAAAVKQPVIIVTGCSLTEKEQMAHVYACELARRGFTALTFDFTGFGQSPGEPRQAEFPSRKINDLKAVADFAATLVRRKRGIGLLAICASAQYGLTAMAQGARLASFVSVAGWFHDASSLAPFYGGEAGMTKRAASAHQVTRAWFEDMRIETVPANYEGDEQVAKPSRFDYANAQSGDIPEWVNGMNAMSWFHWLNFDGIQSASVVTQPCLFVHGDACVLPDNVKRVHAALKAPKELVWGDGSQTDYYDQPGYVERAASAAVRHFEATL